MYNEEESLPLLYNRLTKLADNIKDYDIEFLFVNDGSKDNSLEIVKQLHKVDKRVCYLNLSRNFKIIYTSFIASVTNNYRNVNYIVTYKLYKISTI